MSGWFVAIKQLSGHFVGIQIQCLFDDLRHRALPTISGQVIAALPATPTAV